MAQLVYRNRLGVDVVVKDPTPADMLAFWAEFVRRFNRYSQSGGVMNRRLDRCNKCGEPLRRGICSDEVDCLLDRVAAAHVPVSAGRTHIGRMARPVQMQAISDGEFT